MSHPTIALAAQAVVPPEVDESPLERALVAVGLEWRWAVWDDPAVDWSAFDAVLIRATWDYHERVDAFVAWAEGVEAASRLFSPADVVRWNAHKSYLLALERHGVATVPTAWVARDDPVSVADLASGRGWTDVVVKPAVSVGAIGAHLGPADDPATQEALLAVLATGDALVQPYEPLVQTEGETSTIFIDGEPCHALRKVPAAGDYRSQPHLGGRATPVKPTAQQLALGRAALTAAERITGRRPLYARVDTVASSAGGHQLMELELIEPDLFWEHDTTAATAPRLAAALRSRLR